MALTPTKIYAHFVSTLLENNFEDIKGIAHITGGGFNNVARINSEFDYHFKPPTLNDIPEIFTTLASRSNLKERELYRTFNMGVGMMLIVSDYSKVSALLDELNVTHWKIGETTLGKGEVHINEILCN